MISRVSFCSSTAKNFSERVNMPQTYTGKENPVASSSIGSEKKKSSFGKTLLKGVAVAAAVAGALVLAARSKMFVVPEGATGFVNTLKRGIDKAGNFIDNALKTIVAGAKEQTAKAGEAVAEGVQNAAQTVQNAEGIVQDAAGTVQQAAETVVDAVVK